MTEDRFLTILSSSFPGESTSNHEERGHTDTKQKAIVEEQKEERLPRHSRVSETPGQTVLGLRTRGTARFYVIDVDDHEPLHAPG